MKRGNAVMGSTATMATMATFCLIVACLGAGLAGCSAQPEGQQEPLAQEQAQSQEQAQLAEASGGLPGGSSSGSSGDLDAKEAGQADAQTVQIAVSVNGRELRASLEESPSAQALVELLAHGPLTIAMRDYGSMEKIGPIGQSLPTSDAQITTAPGDIILYQGDQLTIYYDVNSWSLTRVGKIEGVSDAELREILGSGDVEVTFSLD
ncbi:MULTISPECIES: cyclophilin-like fold protein [unclassified Adlercreutzia]|uniref:cyclophilin-like fold protein n=1 Tax=unclassified Adlercreutzia TaxID=2636013 RepID=UPI001980AF14|nr:MULTISPECIES: cyclophilin-like fold protein [unclassified Adlercreutzia]